MKQVNSRFLSARTLLLALVVATVAACGSASKIRKAQDYFSAGASLDNRALLEGNGVGLAGELQSNSELFRSQGARNFYSKALAELDSISAAEDAKLKTDKLLTTKQTLQALCQWRLRRFKDAVATAQNARNEADADEAPRDAILLIALPGLIKNDTAHGWIMAQDGVDAALLTKVKNELFDPNNGAAKDLADARAKAKGHPIDAYLVQCQLALYRNLQLANGKFSAERIAFTVEEAAAIKARLADLNAMGASPELVGRWSKALGDTGP